MQRFFGEKRDQYGRVEPGATVSVYDTLTDNLSTIYSASDPLVVPVVATSNPFTTDGNGQFGFAAPDGVYDITIQGSGSTKYLPKVNLTTSAAGPGADYIARDAAVTAAFQAADAILASQIGGSQQPIINAYTAADAVVTSNFQAADVVVTNAYIAADLADRNALAADSGSSLIGYLAPYTGAVARTQSAKNAESVSILDFGVVCDWNGTTGTDNATALQAALTAAAGKTLYWPGRAYSSVGLTMANTTTIIGGTSALNGTYASGLAYGGTGAALTISPGASGKVFNAAIYNLLIEATGSAKASATGIGLKLVASNYGSFVNVSVKEFNAGIGVLSTALATDIAASNTFTGCTLYNNKIGYSFDGVATGYGDFASLVIGGAVIGQSTALSGSKGITVSQYSAEVQFHGVDVETFEYGIDLFGNGTTSGGGNVFIGCRTEFVGTAHIRVNTSCYDTMLIGHKFEGAGTNLTDNGTRTFRIDNQGSIRLGPTQMQLLNQIPISMWDTGGTARSVLMLANNDTVQIGCGGYAGFNGNYGLGNWNFSGTVTFNGNVPRLITAMSADRGDTSQTLLAGTDARVQRWATALTANRTVTLSTTGAVNGDTFRIVRSGLGAFTLDVGGLKTIPSATAAWAEVSYSGSAWVLTGYGTL